MSDVQEHLAKMLRIVGFSKEYVLREDEVFVQGNGRVFISKRNP
ncbi:hypothetical protein [Streptomyces sp. NPDC096311]